MREGECTERWTRGKQETATFRMYLLCSYRLRVCLSIRPTTPLSRPSVPRKIVFSNERVPRQPITLQHESRSALSEDLALCATFLELDGRNFHCWAHRMWVAGRMGLSAQEEFDFTTDKIKQVKHKPASARGAVRSLAVCTAETP